MFNFASASSQRITPSLRVQVSTASAGAINGSAVDIGEMEGAVMVTVDAPNASASDTIAWTVEHSVDGSTSWAAVPSDALVNPQTGAAATFTTTTDAINNFQTLALKRDRIRRYVRIVATTAGSGITVYIAGWITGIYKYTPAT